MFDIGHKAFWELEDTMDGFCWADSDDCDNSVLTYVRRGKHEKIVVASNFTPVKREKYRIGVPERGDYEIVLSSEWKKFGGGRINRKRIYKSLFKFTYAMAGRHFNTEETTSD